MATATLPTKARPRCGNARLAKSASRGRRPRSEFVVLATILLEDTGKSPQQVIVDLGYRGVDQDNPTVEIIHRGKYKSLTRQQRRWLKRRQAVEPAIGHLKSDHRMDRCWLQGQLGDALHAVLCAAGYNLRWLMRAMVRLGLAVAFLRSMLCWLMATLSRRYPVVDHYEPSALVIRRAA